MSGSTEKTAGGGIGIGGMLFVLFVGLKLTGHIDWSWWWVASPLWIPLGLVLGLMAMFAVLWCVGAVLSAVFASKPRARRRW